MRNRWLLLMTVILSCAVFLFSQAAPEAPAQVAKLIGNTSPESQACIKCHLQQHGSLIVQQWAASRHAQVGIGCFECHQGSGGPAAFAHYGKTVSVLVTPKKCGECHQQQSAQFEASHHAQAGQILGSLDNVLGDVVEGPPAAAMGCAKCHGSIVKVLSNGRLDPATWPNEGIGRVNPDGTLGSCSVCHSRHTFSVAIARQPESCGDCHLGPDHPQAEIYNESKHGVTYRTLIGEMNLKSQSWVLGKDYNAAPTCATCHMGATPQLAETHDVGTRLSWNLRPEVAVRTQDWQRKKAAMQSLCLNCHASEWVNDFYIQYDNAVDLGNVKFFQPAADIMKKLEAAGKLSKTPFDVPFKWTYYELWHHEGRRARMGASMQGPDYVQWHGFYEIAKIFYSEFLPEAEHLLPGVTAEVARSPMNAWMKGLTPQTREQMRQYYENRYKPVETPEGASPANPAAPRK